VKLVIICNAQPGFLAIHHIAFPPACMQVLPGLAEFRHISNNLYQRRAFMWIGRHGKTGMPV